MRSMYAGVSGLKVHQTKMDVIGNNISNVNTVGYKGSRVTFKEMLSQTIKGASAPQNGKGGTNAQQIGLGVTLGSIDTNMGQGNLQSTGKMTDVAIQGEGFFIVNDGQQELYTRAGALSFDQEGKLVNSANGYRIQGWVADESGDINKTGSDNMTDIALDQTMNADATKNIVYNGNLNAAAENDLVASPGKFLISDGGGNTDNINVDLKKTENYNEWKFTLTADDATTTFSSSGTNKLTGYITLDEEGQVVEIDDTKGVGGTSFTGASGISISSVAGGGNTSLDLPVSNDDINSNSIFTANNSGEIVDGKYTLNAKRTITTDVFDSQGTRHTVSLTAKKTSYNTWTIKESDANVSGATANAGTGQWFGGSSHTITFDAEGNVVGGGTVDLTFDPNGGAADGQAVTLDFAEFTQFAGDMTADFDTADGYPQGDLQSFTIDGSGTITGSYDNGYNKTLAKVGIANFSNPAGLSKEGDTLYKTSNNSGEAQVGLAGTGGRGMVAPGTLEMSNVDLAQQFTEMITAQRGFQSNSKIISTSDQMLQTLVNLKR
ncbi:MAG: flagellar hook protein FlgE [Candidatus Frackibacter sp. T328-2]|nr:MAG: flagellar hook protein FlgE [Candidatus Frackibacter sp. T328-2]